MKGIRKKKKKKRRIGNGYQDPMRNLKLLGVVELDRLPSTLPPYLIALLVCFLNRLLLRS